MSPRADIVPRCRQSADVASMRGNQLLTTTTKTAAAAIAATLALGAAAQAATFSNTAPIAVPAADTSGPSDPFPASIAVALAGSISNVTVDLFGLSHTYPDDLFIVVQGPDGTSVVLMSDAGGNGDVNGIDLRFDDAAAAAVPGSGPLSAGSYRVSQYGDVETLPAPAPSVSFGTDLSAFDGSDANGLWNLFVFDDAGRDVGRISGGWALNIDVAAVPLPASLPLLLAGIGAAAALRRRKRS